MKTGLKEIALEAGVSLSTVSRVLNNNPRISREVRDKVLAVARRYDYHPRLPAHLRNIMVLTPDAQDYPAHYCVEMLVMALSAALTQNSYRMEIMPLNNLERLKKIQFYGAVAVGIDADKLQAWARDFNQPLVILDREVKGNPSGIWQISSDEEQCMELAAAHCRERGVRRIGVLVYGEKDSGNSELRMNAARKALEKYAYPVNDELFAYTSQESAVEAVGKMLDNKVDAIFAPGHSGGLLTAYALNIHGRRIPEDISLISSEICFFSPFATPPHTTFCPEYQQLAQRTVELFKARIQGKRFPQKSIIPTRLIPRSSVK
ncbi:MAG: LacI family DNA-binding transcriptional regulator [Victivallales bacterium]|nr:LacI family DNA-binding transcriptional regulator [Victivallales bacterium]